MFGARRSLHQHLSKHGTGLVVDVPAATAANHISHQHLATDPAGAAAGKPLIVHSLVTKKRFTSASASSPTKQLKDQTEDATAGVVLDSFFEPYQMELDQFVATFAATQRHRLAGRSSRWADAPASVAMLEPAADVLAFEAQSLLAEQRKHHRHIAPVQWTEGQLREEQQKAQRMLQRLRNSADR